MLGAPNFLSRHPNLSPWSALFSLCPHRLFQTPPPPPPPSPRGGSEHTPCLPAARSREHACLDRTSFNLLLSFPQPLTKLRHAHTQLFLSKARPPELSIHPLPLVLQPQNLSSSSASFLSTVCFSSAFKQAQVLPIEVSPLPPLPPPAASNHSAPLLHKQEGPPLSMLSLIFSPVKMRNEVKISRHQET